MASSYTGNSGIEKPADGDQSGEWGDTINTNMDIIDRSINGVGAITLSGTTHTLTTTDGTLSDGMYKVLVLGGSPSGTNTITISPNDQDKVYFVVNSSGETATFTQGGGANVSVLNGDIKIIYADGAGSGAAVVDVTANLSFSSVNIDGGTIDGTTIGAASASTGAFTTVTASGTLDIVGVATATTFEPDGDTAAGDNAAIGYTSAEGLILTGQGSTSDLTVKNDADETVFTVPTGTDDILFPDSAKAMFGAGSDLQIYHDGSNSRIEDSGTGSLVFTTNELSFQNADGDEVIIGGVADAAVTLYHNNAAKLATASTGVTITGEATATGFTGTLDGILGSGSAAAATTTTLDTSGVVNLNLVTDSTSSTSGALIIDGGVGIAKKLFVGTDFDVSGNSVIDGTALVTGVLTSTATQVATGGITSGSDIVSDADSTDDLGTTSVRWANLFVDAITATDQITATGFTGTLDGILGSGAAAAATTTTLASTNITASGTLGVTGETTLASHLNMGDSDIIKLGDGNDLQIYHDGSNSRIEDSGTGSLVFTTNELSFQNAAGDEAIIGGVADGAVSLYYNNAVKIATASTGVTITGEATATGFTGTLDGILGSGTAAAATTTTLDTSGAVNLNLVTDSTSSTSGALIVDGGVGVAKKLFVGTDFDVSGNSVIDGTALVTGVLTTTATQVATGGITSGSDIVSDTDSTDDLGTTGVRWANLFVDAITATDQITATGFTGTLDGILGSGAAAAASVTTLTTSGIASIDDTTDTTSGTTGSIHTDGGVGVAKALYVGTTAKIIGVTTHGGNVVSDADSTDDLGTTGVRWANLFVDAITATDQITATGFTGTLDGILGSGAAAAATVTTLNTSGAVVHNEAGAAVDFRVEGDTDPHLIFAAGGVDRVVIGGSDSLLFNAAGTNAKLVVVGSSSNTSVVQNGNAAIAIVNTDQTDENTAGLHFARADTDDSPNYAGASIVAQFKETQATGQYPSATLSFLTSTTQNAAPSVKMTLSEAGNLNVTGALSKGSGSFKINHPLESKKDTHYLAHSFVEGAQADNIYRGKIDLVSGTATINIDTVSNMTDGTFVALNREVQCFTTNETGWTAVKGSVSENVLTITAQDNTCTDTTSWMVIGERQDQHMYEADWTDSEGKVITEPLKEA